MARYNWRKASIDEAIDRAAKREHWASSARPRRRYSYTNAQRAAYWKRKYMLLKRELGK